MLLCKLRCIHDASSPRAPRPPALQERVTSLPTVDFHDVGGDDDDEATMTTRRAAAMAAFVVQVRQANLSLPASKRCPRPEYT